MRIHARAQLRPALGLAQSSSSCRPPRREHGSGGPTRRRRWRAAARPFGSSAAPHKGGAAVGVAAVGGAEALVGRLGWLPRDLEVLRADGNRARYGAAAFCNHLALGSSFSFSMWLSSFTRIDGVVAQAGTDWAMGDVTPAFSLIMGGFVWAGVFGGVQQRIGARASCLVGAAGIGSGFALMGTACEMHSLPLLLTAAAIQGLGNGFAYVPPVAALVSWFPERKGLASGTAIGEYICRIHNGWCFAVFFFWRCATWCGVLCVRSCRMHSNSLFCVSTLH